jgi:hypothetical protein
MEASRTSRIKTGARTAQEHYQQTGPSSMGECSAALRGLSRICSLAAWLKPCPPTLYASRNAMARFLHTFARGFEGGIGWALDIGLGSG